MTYSEYLKDCQEEEGWRFVSLEEPGSVGRSYSETILLWVQDHLVFSLAEKKSFWMPPSLLHALCETQAVLCHRNPIRATLARLESSSSSLIFLDLLITLTSSTCWPAWEHMLSLSFLWTPSPLSVLYPWLSETRPCPEILVLGPLFWCFSSWCIAWTFNGAPSLIFTSPLPMIHLSSETQPGKTQTCFTPQTVLLFHLPTSVTAALLSWASAPAFSSFFSLESTTKSYWLFTYRVSWICSSFSSPTITPKELVLVTSLQVS